MKKLTSLSIAAILAPFLLVSLSFGQAATKAKINTMADKLQPKLVAWRRDFHQNPELGNREFKTAEKIAAHLRSLGIDVTTGVAKTGVVGILKGGKPGPVVALRADIDALPVAERVDLPFASKVTTEYNGQTVGVMHACGHDTHTAILMSVAEVLASMKGDLKGTVKFIFQPAEEGAPTGEEGGGQLMVKEKVLENPKVDVIFALHIDALLEVGHITYRPGGTMASADDFSIKVKGKQSHGGYPWLSVDPIVVSAQIITGLQTIVSRQIPLTQNAGVISIGAIHGGVRNNIIPEQVEMIGTIRALDTTMRQEMHAKIRRTATLIAESAGATAEVEIGKNTHYPITYNDPKLTEKMVPTLQAVAGKENVMLANARTGAEDFSYFQQQIPGLYIFLGGAPKGKKPTELAPHHTPDFYIDESGLSLGVKTLSNLVVDYMNAPAK